MDTILRQEVMDRHGSEGAIGVIDASAHATQEDRGAGGDTGMGSSGGARRLFLGYSPLGGGYVRTWVGSVVLTIDHGGHTTPVGRDIA